MRRWTRTVLVMLAAVMLIVGCSKGETESESEDIATEDMRGTPAGQYSFLQVDMQDDRSGWALSTSLQVLRTGDGGKSWQDVTPSAFTELTPSQIVKPVAEFRADQAWVAVNLPQEQKNIIFSTNDGGQAWKESTIVVEQGQTAMINDIDFWDEKTGWLLISHGAGAGSLPVSVYQTVDGGANWQLVTQSDGSTGGIPSSGFKTGISFRNESDGWVTGLDYSDALWLYGSRDSGKTWQKQELPLPDGMKAEGGSAITYPPLFFERRGLLGGDEGLLPVESHLEGHALYFYHTSNGGDSWQATTPVRTSQEGGKFVWSFADADHGWVSDGTELLRTTDQGRSWNKVQTNQDLSGLEQLEFSSSETGLAILGGKLYQTSDGGKTWKPL